MRHITALVLVLAVLTPSRGSAQVTVVEESEVEVVERGYVQGVGRGIQYGAHITSPIYVTPIQRGGGSRDLLGMNAGGGVRARIGWEFPSGLSIEVYGGLAFNGVSEVLGEDPMRSHVLTQGNLNLGLRYSFFNETAFVPFIQAAGGARFLYFTWPNGDEESPVTAAVASAAVGAQIELSPFFGIELGALVDYVFGMDAFETGFLSVTPFVGVTLYVYDEND